ncbi:MAG: hypothetical protein ACTHMU_03855 [Thermomicrobiales bacterium]
MPLRSVVALADAALIRHAQALWEAGRLAEWREAVAELRRREMGE